MTIHAIKPYPLPRAQELPDHRLPWRPEAARSALLVHDMQRYFLRFYQADQEPMREAMANMQRLVSAARHAHVPVIYSAQPAEPERANRKLLNDLWGPGLTALPEQADITPELAPLSHELVLRKTRYSAFHATELASFLREQKRDQLWICGVYAHIGCMITAFDAFMHDVQPFLAFDALMDFSRQHHELAGRMVSERCGVVTATDALIATTQDWAERLVDGSLHHLFAIDRANLSNDISLRDAGLDSVRMMELAEHLRSAGALIESVDLMECQDISALHAAVRRAPS